MDQGIQTFRMKLIPHIGTWREAGIPRKAEEFLTPATCVYQGIHGGKLPKSDSFMSVDASNIVISSVKLSENGDDLIVRCVETNGEQTTATIDLKIAGKQYQASFRPCEIKTLRVDKKTKQIQEVNLLEE